MRELRTWPPPALAALAARPVARLPFPLEEPGIRLYAQARQALYRCLPPLGIRPGDEALVPSYHHGSEVEALLRTGLRCRSYEPGEDLQPDEQELDRLVGPHTRVLHLIHYLGFPQDSARWRRWCDARGLLLVEDAAQAWLAERDGRPVGSHGDLAVFCLYKTLGLPDGAAVVARVPLPKPEGPGELGILHLAKPAVRTVLRRAGWSPSATEYDQAQDNALPDRTRAPALATRWLLPRAAAVDAAGARRAAYTTLLAELGHLVPLPFAELPDGASPFTFPIAVRDKPTALATLGAHGIEGLDLWSRAHPALPGRPGCTAAHLREHVVGLPVHQYLRRADLGRLVAAAKDLEPADRARSRPAS